MNDAKGLILSVYRNPTHRSPLNALDAFDRLTIVRIVQDERWKRHNTGPLPVFHQDCAIFTPTEERPAVELVWRIINGRHCHYIRPLGWHDGKGMAGGSYADTSDSRWCSMFSFYGAIPIHDRVE